MSGLFEPETIWVLIPLAAIIGGFITKSQRIRATARTARDDQILEEIRQAVIRLESRVSNLERAVMTAETERKFAL
jgi:hypothetical protein